MVSSRSRHDKLCWGSRPSVNLWGGALIARRETHAIRVRRDTLLVNPSSRQPLFAWPILKMTHRRSSLGNVSRSAGSENVSRCLRRYLITFFHRRRSRLGLAILQSARPDKPPRSEQYRSIATQCGQASTRLAASSSRIKSKLRQNRAQPSTDLAAGLSKRRVRSATCKLSTSTLDKISTLPRDRLL